MSTKTLRALRILEIETFGRGGLTHYAFNLSRALADRGHEVTLVTTAGFELDDQSRRTVRLEIVKALAPIEHQLGDRWPKFILSLLRKTEAITDAFRLGALARELRPDVIHLHCTNPIALLYLGVLERLGTTLVSTAHVVTPHEPIPFQRSIYRRIHGFGDLIIAHSNWDRRRLLDEFGVAQERVSVIPHGEYGFFSDPSAPVDREAARCSLGLAAEDEVALFFGYIREYKGLDVLFDAWPAVDESRPRARLVVAGDAGQLPATRRSELEQRAVQLGASSRFGYVPFSDVHRYFAAADVLVMPYRHISQSGVLYLALSLGVPVVATRVGGLPEILSDGLNALLVPPESPADLAGALVQVLGDRGLRDRLSQGGLRLAEEHSWPSIAKQTERAFNDLRQLQRDNS